MRRHTIDPRADWQRSVERMGLTYHTLEDGSPYWDESAYWEFSAARSTGSRRLRRRSSGWRWPREMRFWTGICWTGCTFRRKPWQHIRETWQSEPPALYGRLDLAYDGHQIKLLEYNADTPTCLVEAAVAQWYWLEERFPNADQFNSLHEKLVAKWKDLDPYVSQPVYFSHDGGKEDAMTIAYLRDTAQQARLEDRRAGDAPDWLGPRREIASSI